MVPMGTSKGSPKVDEAPKAPGVGCPECGEPWLRPTQLPGRLRCVFCLTRFEIVSQCPDCGTHQTIARMSTTEDMTCQTCSGSMLRPV